jgi:hypothetical protein
VRGITAKGVGTRYLFAFALVVLTWNPSPVNYVRWATNQWSEMAPIVLFVSLILMVGWVVFVRATLRSLGPIGVAIAIAVAGSILWIIIDFGLIDPSNSSVLGWVLLTLLAAIMTAGMSWSHLRRRWSGQADVDDIEDVGD